MAAATEAQLAVCRRYGAVPDAPDLAQIAGVGAMTGLPVNGLRHPAKDGTCGWYVWTGGEIDQLDDSFFAPMHLAHLVDEHPVIVPFLALPPGWRFLIAPGHEDVWFDPMLFDVD